MLQKTHCITPFNIRDNKLIKCFLWKNKAVEFNPLYFMCFIQSYCIPYIFFWSLVNITPGYVVTKTSKKIFFSNMKRKETMQRISKKSNWSPLEIIGTEFHLLWTMDRSSCLNSTRNRVYVCWNRIIAQFAAEMLRKINTRSNFFSFSYNIKFDHLKDKSYKS